MVYEEHPSLPLLGKRYVVCNWRDALHPLAGGAELYCERVARGLADLGAEVVLLTSRPTGTPRQERTAYGRVVRLGRTYTTYPLALIWLARHGRSADGIIDCENGIPYFSPLVVGRRTAVVLVMHHVHQDQFRTYFPPVARDIAAWLERRAAARVYGRRAVCAVSPSTRDAIRRRLCFRGPIFVAPNGVELPGAAGAPRAQTPTIVYVGRLVRHKRVDLLINALPRLREIHPGLTLDVVGDGPERGRLVSLAQSLGVGAGVRFHGRVDDGVRDELMARAWLAVNPSAGEGWGLSVIEAAAFGVPTVARRVPGLSDSVLHGRTGWLCESEGDLADTVSAAITALEDPSEATRYADACREWASTFGWTRTAERIERVLSSEAERLRRGYRDRREAGDVYTVVNTPVGSLDVDRLRALRRTDQVRVKAGLLQLLLPNADELDAPRALVRVGLPPGTPVTVRLARPSDLLGWDAVPAPAPDVAGGVLVDLTNGGATATWSGPSYAGSTVIP